MFPDYWNHGKWSSDEMSLIEMKQMNRKEKGSYTTEVIEK